MAKAKNASVEDETKKVDKTGENAADTESAPTGEKEADTESAPTGEKEADTESAPTGEKEADTESAPTGEKEADTESAPTGENEADNESAPTGENAADTESAPTRENTGGSEDTGDEEDEDSQNVARDLVAVYPILYLSHQYQVGDKLPANNPDMVQAWLDAGTAAWLPINIGGIQAIQRTAEPGLPGQAFYSESKNGEDLVGKVPRAGRRKK